MDPDVEGERSSRVICPREYISRVFLKVAKMSSHQAEETVCNI